MTAEPADLPSAHDGDEQLRAMLDATPAMVSIKDAEGRYLYVNRGFSETMGLPFDQVVGRTMDAVYPLDTVSRLLRAERQVMASGDDTVFEHRLPAADGGDHIFLSLKFPLRDRDGVIRSVGTISTDVTEVRQVTAALADSEDRFRQLAETIDEVFVLIGIDPLTVLYVNPALERLLGAAGAQFRADPRSFVDRLHPDDRYPFMRSVVGAFDRGQPEMLELRLLQPDGEVRWMRCRLTPARTGVDAPRRWVATVKDVTDQKHAELALRSALAEAERASGAKSEFLSRVSHELRTPLNAILGFGQLLELDELEPVHEESVQHILRAGRHLLGLIDEILEISRIESGQLRLSLEPVDLAESMGEALDMVRPLAARRSIELIGRPRPGSWGWVRADNQRLKQVLLNLLSNAVKYNRDGGSVRVDVLPSATGRLRASVTDTGIGIPAVDLERIFLPFDRLMADQSGEEGTGLGLTLTKGLLEAMGGAIGVRSDEGEGSEFWIDLAGEVAPGDPQPPAEAGAADRPPATPTTHTVLYVEDNVSNVHLVERLLDRRPGVVLISTMQGSLALDLAAEHQPDLVLLDLGLPDVSGEEVLRRLRAEPATAAIPVVILSADATARQVARLTQMGALDYLTKPLDLQRFYRVVDGVLSLT